MSGKNYNYNNKQYNKDSNYQGYSGNQQYNKEGGGQYQKYNKGNYKSKNTEYKQYKVININKILVRSTFKFIAITKVIKIKVVLNPTIVLLN
jgi:hypothetical protein